MIEFPKQDAGAVDLFEYLLAAWKETEFGRAVREETLDGAEDFVEFAQRRMRENQPLSITPMDNFAIRLQDSTIVSLVKQEDEQVKPNVGEGIAITQPAPDKYGKGGMQSGHSAPITNPVDTGRTPK